MQVLWDANHPIMAGIDDDFDYNYIVRSWLQQDDPNNANVESIMNIVSDTTDYDYSHVIFSKSLGRVMQLLLVLVFGIILMIRLEY